MAEMGKVLDFVSRTAVTDRHFVERIRSGEMQRRTWDELDDVFFGHETDGPVRSGFVPDVRVSMDEYPMGIVKTATGNPRTVHVSNSFPNFLIKEKVRKEKALDIASASVLAVTALHIWYSNLLYSSQRDAMCRLAQRSEMLPSYPNNWQRDVYDASGLREVPFKQSPLVLFSRVAGRVALNVAKVDDIDFSEPQPYPPHIAGLSDAMERFKARQLGNAANV